MFPGVQLVPQVNTAECQAEAMGPQQLDSWASIIIHSSFTLDI